MPVRLPTALLVLALGLTIGLVAVAVSSGLPGEPSTQGPAGVEHRSLAVVDPPGPLGVLRAWDRQRAAAWAAGDASALGRLYTARSTARAADLALLRRYAVRGLVVRGMRMQVLRARVLTERPRLLELEVTDRLASATVLRASDPADGRLLPADGATTRRLVLRRVGERWLMADASAPLSSAVARGR